MRAWLAAIGAAALVAACGGSEAPVSTTPAPTATPTPAAGAAGPGRPLGASTPADAVQALLPTGGTTICRPSSGPRWSQAAGCPVTTRLEQRLQANPTSGSAGGADPICRCQNVAPVMLAPAGTSASAGTALVNATFQFQPPLLIRFTVVQQGQGSGWLVDDSDCGDPSSSIYGTPVKRCGP